MSIKQANPLKELEKGNSRIKERSFRIFQGKYSTPVYRLIVGGLFIFAGIAKLGYLDSLIWEIKQYRILPDLLAKIYGYVLPYSEIAIGVLLLTGVLLKISASLAGLLTLSFTIAKISAMVRGISISVCSCFGPFIALIMVQSLAIDIVLLVLTVLIITKPNMTLTFHHLILKK
jgi:uncharacterized membrane protein YphA (DoxX/SURF4 family)